ncbi:phage antirepressor KilAC domain-containing protein [Endozoicomonas sp. Mp262]|uniref:phage antirepressor KilAC domain-containing protein n=1 Tax=Endozoicomonas sp. Mp262 TaxID=2919499 RepID=UPI0021DA0FF8
MGNLSLIHCSEKTEQTMSHIEIAGLAGKRPDSVKRTMDSLQDKGLILVTQSVEPYISGRGRSDNRTVYGVNKRDSYVVMAQVSPEFTARLVDRWQELEARSNKPEIPQTYAAALLEAGRLAQLAENQQKQLEAQAPKVEFVEKYTESKGSKGFRQVARLLGIKEPEFREFLQSHRIMYSLGGEWTAYKNHIDAGRFVVRTGVSETNGHAFTQCRFTAKGIEYVAGLIGREKALALPA